MKISKEHFEVFIDLDGFDSLLEYQNSSVTYGKLFDYNRIIIGESDNPIRQFEPKYNHLKSKPKIYKCFYNLKTSYYDEFESLPDDYSYPSLNENTKKNEILISEDSQKFLDFFNKVEKELDSKNFLNYRFEKVISKSHESIQNTYFSEQEFQLNEDTVLRDPTVKETVFENNNTITEVIEKTLNTNNVINQVEKAWEKVIEKTKLEKQQKDKYSFETNISEENNTINQTSKTINNKNNNVTNINNTDNSSNILNNIEILKSNQTVQYITKTVEESIENKFKNVINQINNQNIVNNQTMIDSIDKIIKKQNEENRNLQKKTTTNVESTLDKFLRS